MKFTIEALPNIVIVGGWRGKGREARERSSLPLAQAEASRGDRDVAGQRHAACTSPADPIRVVLLHFIPCSDKAASARCTDRAVLECLCDGCIPSGETLESDHAPSHHSCNHVLASL
eukprot:scaffold77479_cov38-Tisochrysis_lutea.AAC.1